MKGKVCLHNLPNRPMEFALSPSLCVLCTQRAHNGVFRVALGFSKVLPLLTYSLLFWVDVHLRLFRFNKTYNIKVKVSSNRLRLNEASFTYFVLHTNLSLNFYRLSQILLETKDLKFNNNNWMIFLPISRFTIAGLVTYYCVYELWYRIVEMLSTRVCSEWVILRLSDILTEVETLWISAIGELCSELFPL